MSKKISSWNGCKKYGILIVEGKNMINLSEKTLCLAVMLIIATPLYAENGITGVVDGATACSFTEWLNPRPKAPYIDEKQKIREDWERTLGVDIFHPYFKVKKLESRIQDKCAVRFLNIKGRLQFKENEAKYIFSIKF